MKDEEAIDWKEGFFKLPLNKENKFKEGHGRFTKEEWYLVCFFFQGKKKR
jgi:hypothetical protein